MRGSHGMAWVGTAGLVKARQGVAGEARPGRSWPGTVWPGEAVMAGPGMARLGNAGRGKAWLGSHGWACHRWAWRGDAWRGRQGAVWPGTARSGMARRGRAWQARKRKEIDLVSDLKVRENRLRRIADRRGMRLTKSRRRDPRAVDYGQYTLTGRDGETTVYMDLAELEREVDSNEPA